MNKLTQAVIAVLVIAFFVQGWRVRAAQSAVLSLEVAADSMRADILADSLAADSSLTFAFAARDSVDALLQQSDSAVIDLARRVTAANARIVQITRSEVEARGEIASLASALQARSDSGGVQVSAQGEFDDGLLRGLWSFELPPGSLSFPYTCSPTIEQYTVALGDGRQAVVVRSPDERVRIPNVRTVFEPLPPVTRYRLSKGWAAGVGFAGYVLGRWTR